MDALYKKATEIIKQIEYLNIASITLEGLPWNSPVYCSYDSQLNFYWMSWKKNQHSQNIRLNANVFATIYDSTVPPSTGVGIYFQGKAYELTNPKDILIGLTTHYLRVNKKIKAIIMFLSSHPRRVYKFVPEKCWINGNEKIQEETIDVRTELDMDKLTSIFKK
jgi:uncharacterized protein YhbP (UPF0306 family)